MTDNFLTVEPWEVNHGDVLAGVPGANGRPVDEILYDGSDGWWVYGCEGVVLDRRAPWHRVQVVRGGGVEAPNPSASFPATTDECPPHGIRRVRGVYLVVP